MKYLGQIIDDADMVNKKYVDDAVAGGGGGGAVDSVNGKTGAVVLTASDVSAVPTTRKVNNKALSTDITLSASDVSAIPTSDKQSYNSASSLSWNSLSADQKAMVPTIQGIAFWNGAYDGSSSNLKYSANGEICGKSGFTMTGQILTSYKSSVATGSYQATATTVDGLAGEVRYSSGCMGSANITTAYTKNSITMSTGWYNFFYVPHRSGGVNGSASGDNCNYGTLTMWGMTIDTPMYVLRFASGSIQSLHSTSYKEFLSSDSTKSVSANTVTDLGSLSLSKGTWIVTSYVRSNSSGSNIMANYINCTSLGANYCTRSTQSSGGGSVNSIILDLSSTETVKSQAYFTTAGTATYYLRAERIG